MFERLKRQFFVAIAGVLVVVQIGVDKVLKKKSEGGCFIVGRAVVTVVFDQIGQFGQLAEIHAR